MLSPKRFYKQLKSQITRYAYSITDRNNYPETQLKEKTLLIVKSDHIGDYFLFRNFLPYLRQSEKYKGYKITLLGNIAWKSIAENFDAEYYDTTIWVSFDKLQTNLIYRAQEMKRILNTQYDVLFYPVFSGNESIEESLISKILAKQKITFSENERLNPVFDVVWKSDKPDMFETDRYQEMMEKFLSIRISQFQWRQLPASATNIEVAGPYIVLFPDSKVRKKRWSAENFALVANALLQKYDYRLIIAGGEKAGNFAKTIIKSIPAEHKHRITNLTGKTSLAKLAGLISKAELLITNDSIAIHMAAAYNTPGICIFMGENYGRFAPYPKSVYSKGSFICPPDVERKVALNGDNHVFLNLGYYPELNHIKADSVVKTAISVLNTVNVVSSITTN